MLNRRGIYILNRFRGKEHIYCYLRQNDIFVMCTSYGYKCLPFALAFISFIEMLLGMVRVFIFFSPKPSGNISFFDTFSFSPEQMIMSPCLLSRQGNIAFIFDWIASIIPTLMGIYVALFILLIFITLFVMCSCIWPVCVCLVAVIKRKHNFCSKWFQLIYIMCTNKANHRCVSLACNCPWYTARPQLRFYIRFGFLSFFIVLRMVAIILYVTDKSVGIYGKYMGTICTISVVVVCLTLWLDFYQYRVWWYYRPDGLYKRCRCLCCKQKFHPSHQRFLPAPLLGTHRNTYKTGNRPCKYTESGHCPNLTLEHIVIFHAFDYIPQKRYELGSDSTYIVFHQTRPEYAVNIAQTGFQISDKPPQMLGFGVYFARSFKDTGNKARQKGEQM